MIRNVKTRGRSSAEECQLPKLTQLASFLSKSADKLGEIGCGCSHFIQSHFSIFSETIRTFFSYDILGEEKNEGSLIAMASKDALHGNNQRMVQIYQAL